MISDSLEQDVESTADADKKGEEAEEPIEPAMVKRPAGHGSNVMFSTVDDAQLCIQVKYKKQKGRTDLYIVTHNQSQIAQCSSTLEGGKDFLISLAKRFAAGEITAADMYSLRNDFVGKAAASKAVTGAAPEPAQQDPPKRPIQAEEAERLPKKQKPAPQPTNQVKPPVSGPAEKPTEKPAEKQAEKPAEKPKEPCTGLVFSQTMLSLPM